MSDILLEAQREQATDQQNKQFEADAITQRLKYEASECYKKLDTLYRSPEMKWFIENCQKPFVEDERVKALDVKTGTAETRNLAAHKYDFGAELVDLLKSRRQFWAAQAGIPIID